MTESQKERVCVYWFTPQMPEVAIVRPEPKPEAGMLSRSSTLVAGSQLVDAYQGLH